MSSSLSAATLLPAVFLVQLVIVVNGQYQFYGAQTQYLLVQVPGELDKINSTFSRPRNRGSKFSDLQCTQYFAYTVSHKT